jgi:hypothetical protein
MVSGVTEYRIGKYNIDWTPMNNTSTGTVEWRSSVLRQKDGIHFDVELNWKRKIGWTWPPQLGLGWVARRLGL